MFTKLNKFITITSIFLVTASCEQNYLTSAKTEFSHIDFYKSPKRGKPQIEIDLINQGLVDIQAVDTSIRIDLRYSTPNNFVGIDLYGDLERVYAQPDLVEMLKESQSLLKKKDSNLSLLVFDAVRPLHIQQLMWDSLVMPFYEKTKFLSNPSNRSVHNYGAAIDLSIMNILTGEELDMGTPYDFIGKLGHPRLEKEFLKSGELTQRQINNRLLLREVMTEAGFRQLQTEWWHYNSCPRSVAKKKYKLIE